MVKVTELAAEICNHEKGKEEVNIAQMMEILKVIADLEPVGSLTILKKYARHRANKKKAEDGLSEIV